MQCDRLIYGEQKLVCIIQAYWSRNKRLLFWYMTSKPVNPAIPLLIINTLDIDEDNVRLELGVDELFASHAVSDVRVECMENTVDYSDQVSIIVIRSVLAGIYDENNQYHSQSTVLYLWLQILY